MINQSTYIYYLHGGDNIPFYVGKTIREDNSRLNAHKNILKTKIYLEVIDEIPTKEWIFGRNITYVYLKVGALS